MIDENFTGWDAETDTYYINGVATTLNSDGNGRWNNLLYSAGMINENFTGWDSETNTYYTNGVATTLNSGGNGVWNNVFYSGGVATTIDSTSLTGWASNIYNNRSETNGMYFINGGAYNGLNSSGTGPHYDVGHGGFEKYYLNGVETTLDGSGSGLWNNVWYINSTQTTLDTSGNGVYNNKRYANGSLINGWSSEDNGYYVFGDLVTTINQNGVGLYNGVYYSDVQKLIDNFPSQGRGTAIYNGVYYRDGYPANGSYTVFSNNQYTTLYYSNGLPFTGTADGIDYISGKTVYHFTNTVDSIFDTLGNWYLDSALTIPAPNIPPAGSHVKVSPSCTSTNLNFVSKGLVSLDVSGCTSLQALYCDNNQLTSLNVSGCTSLRDLYCHYNQLTSLDVSGCTSLQELYCQYNQLTSLNVSGLTSLQDLYCQNNQLTSLNVSGLTSLQNLYCNNNQLASLNVSGLTSLQTLHCGNNQLTSLNVSGCTSLQNLYCNNNQLASLNVSGLTSLQNLYCNNNQLTSLNVSGCTGLQDLYCFNNQLNDIELDNISTQIPDRTGGSPGRLYCWSNIGSETCDPTIATAKNWQVLITEPVSGGGSSSGSGSGSGSGDNGVGLTIIGEFLNGKYYINGVATTLNENGNGVWRGRRYLNGILRSDGGYTNGIIGRGPNSILAQIVQNSGSNIEVNLYDTVKVKFTEILIAGLSVGIGESSLEKLAIVPQYNENNLILASKIDAPTQGISGPIELTFYIPENFSQDVFNRCKIYHVKTDNTVEELSRVSSNLATREIVVSVNSFSDFVIMDNPPAATSALIKIQGKTKFFGNVKFVS